MLKPPNITSTPVSRRATALAELIQILTDEKINLEPTTTARTSTSGEGDKCFPGAIAREFAQNKVDQANLRITALQADAEEVFIISSMTEAKYFEAYGRVLESTVAQETNNAGESTAADLDSNELPDLEYDYQIAIATASEAEAVAPTAKSDLNPNEQRLSKINSVESTTQSSYFNAGGDTSEKSENIRKIAALQSTDFSRRMSAAGGQKNKKNRSRLHRQ